MPGLQGGGGGVPGPPRASTVGFVFTEPSVVPGTQYNHGDMVSYLMDS